MRVHLAPNVPSFLCLSIPEDIIPLFWDWLQEDRLSIKRSFPCQESKEWLVTLHYRQEGEETPRIPWVMVQMQRRACVRLVWEKPGTAESHIIGFIPIADIRPIAERAMGAFLAAQYPKQKR